MAVTTLASLLDGLVASLSTRAGLAGVNVFGCNVPPEMLGREAIELAARVDVAQAAAQMGSDNIAETYRVDGSILVSRPLAAAATTTDTVNVAAAAARDRALAIYGEVVEQLAADESVGGVVRWAAPGGLVLEQGFAPEGQLGRVCRVEFTVSCEAEVTV
jgi:hypothetical protein